MRICSRGSSRSMLQLSWLFIIYYVVHFLDPLNLGFGASCPGALLGGYHCCLLRSSAFAVNHGTCVRSIFGTVVRSFLSGAGISQAKSPLQRKEDCLRVFCAEGTSVASQFSPVILAALLRTCSNARAIWDFWLDAAGEPKVSAGQGSYRVFHSSPFPHIMASASWVA